MSKVFRYLLLGGGLSLELGKGSAFENIEITTYQRTDLFKAAQV